MPIRFDGRDWEFEALAKHLANKRGISIEKARAFVAGIEKNQKADGRAKNG